MKNNKKEELISVIIPIYNVEKYLEKCLETIVKQTYLNLEILLIDDGSTDKSAEICDNYAKEDNRIRVVHKENRGVSNARNIGIEVATGNYVIFIDADDYVELNMIEKLYNNIKKEDYDISICNFKCVIDTKVEPNIIEAKDGKLNQKEFITNLFDEKSYRGYMVNKLIKRECIENIRLDEEIHVMEDLVFWLNISKNINKAYFEKDLYLYYYVKRENSASRCFNNEKYFSIITAFERTIPFLDECDINIKNKMIFDYLSYVMTAYYYYYENDRKKFVEIKQNYLKIRKQYFWQAMKTNCYGNMKKIKLFILSYFPLVYGKLKKIKDL